MPRSFEDRQVSAFEFVFIAGRRSCHDRFGEVIGCMEDSLVQPIGDTSLSSDILDTLHQPQLEYGRGSLSRGQVVVFVNKP